MRLLGKIVRYALGIFCILIGGILFLGGMITYPSSSYPSSVLFMMFFSIAVLISGVIFIRSPQTNKLSNGNNRYRYRTNNGTVELTSQVEHDRQIRIQAVQNMQVLPVVEYPTSIILKPQEICYYQNSATVIIIKNEVVGRTGGHRGASVRIARGLTVHTGGSASRTIRQDVPYYYDGILSITNQRVIMTGEKGFDYQIGKLTSIVQFDDAQGVTLQFGRYTHSISVSDPYLIAKIIELIQNGARTEIDVVSESDRIVESSILPLQQSNPEQYEPHILEDIVDSDMFPIETRHIDVEELVESPDNAELSYLDAEALRFWNKKRTDFVIPPYYAQSAFGRNAAPALIRLLENGYIEIAGMEQRIALKTVPELKAILADRKLKVSGTKPVLIQRILENLSKEDLVQLFSASVYQITEKGENALQPYSIIETCKKYNLDLSHYRLMQEKNQHPNEDDKTILTRLLSEDLQKCYENGDRSSFQIVITKTARFMDAVGETQTALECYILSFFVWRNQISASDIYVPQDSMFYVASHIEQCSKKCNYSLPVLLNIFEETIQNNQPFGMGTPSEIQNCIQDFLNALSIPT